MAGALVSFLRCVPVGGGQRLRTIAPSPEVGQRPSVAIAIRRTVPRSSLVAWLEGTGIRSRNRGNRCRGRRTRLDSKDLLATQTVRVVNSEITGIAARPRWGGWGEAVVTTGKRTYRIATGVLEEEAQEIANCLRHVRG